jgi:DNA (cytosine-5)-methyltransferase 1
MRPKDHFGLSVLSAKLLSMSFTFIDLFAGIGGFHAALEPLGGECVFVSEWDEHAAEIYKNNWLKDTEIEVTGDIRKFTEGKSINVPRHDVLTGGFPCQPFSKSGNQLGVNETRGTLFYNILRIIESKKPKIVLLENVRNLVGPKHYSDYLIMVRLLRELGYAVSEIPTILSPHEIPKKFGGSPQHRQRVFIGAIRVGAKRALVLEDIAPVLDRKPFAEMGEPSWNIKVEIASFYKNKEKPQTEFMLNDDQIKAVNMWEDFLKQFRSNNDLNPPGLPMWTEFWLPRSKVRISRETPDWKRQFIEKNIELYESNRIWIDKWEKKHKLREFIPSYRKFEWQGKNSKSIYDCLIQFRPSGIRVKEPTYIPAFVAMAQTPVLGWEKRELSEYEASRIQGFPKGFTFGEQRRALTLKQIGNAVHPGSATLIFHALVERAKELDLAWAHDLISPSKKVPNYPSNLTKLEAND